MAVKDIQKQLENGTTVLKARLLCEGARATKETIDLYFPPKFRQPAKI